MALTPTDFEQKIAAVLSANPVAAQLYQINDPVTLSQLRAAAAMLSMVSAEQDVASTEIFIKSRDVTVLADAAVKGVLPFGKPLRVKINVTNVTDTDFNVNTGRILLDQRGRTYVVSIGAIIPANGNSYISAVQIASTSFDHTVTVDQPFYRIDIPSPDTGVYITAVDMVDSLGNVFENIQGYLNVEMGDRVFHIESDENQALYIKLGADGIAGYQPSIGEVFTITTDVTEGDITLAAGTKFTFAYSISPSEIGSILTLDSVEKVGAAPMDINTVREITSYPSLYDNNAVYLGNFDFLIRRNLNPFDFLSVWNEHVEESVRGPNIDNINRLFIAAQKTGISDETLIAEIDNVINTADDSYNITHISVVPEFINVSVTAFIAPVYDFVAVAQQIKEIILAQYGAYSIATQRGSSKILYKTIYALLTASVVSLQDKISDLQVSVHYVGNDDGEIKPNKVYTRSSTTVTVQFIEHNFIVGDAVQITNATDSGNNGTQLITAVNADDFSFETTASGADGTLNVMMFPKPEKWRFVDASSLTVNIQQAG